MRELLRKLEEERCCSSSMKDRMSVLQQQLCDAQSSAQVNFKMHALSKSDSSTPSKWASCDILSNSCWTRHALILCVFAPLFFRNQESLCCILSAKTQFT